METNEKQNLIADLKKRIEESESQVSFMSYGNDAVIFIAGKRREMHFAGEKIKKLETSEGLQEILHRHSLYSVCIPTSMSLITRLAAKSYNKKRKQEGKLLDPEVSTFLEFSEHMDIYMPDEKAEVTEFILALTSFLSYIEELE